ncbi:unnamed protein product, partial [Clonostachys rosea f. rosea IK726]
MELLSSTSKEFASSGMGQKLSEFIILVPKQGLGKGSHVVIDDNWRKYLKETENRTQNNRYGKISPHAILQNFSRCGKWENRKVESDRLSSTLELWIVAIIGTILQLGVVAYWAFATYYPTLQYPKDDKRVANYAYPCAAAGTLTLVVSMMLCSHVVESRTTETRYIPHRKAHDIYFCWLQQEKVVNDQSFNSHIVYCKKKNEYIITSKRDGKES